MKNSKLHLVIDTLIKLCVVVTLIVSASTKQQYSYYIFLRLFVFVTFLYFSYRSYIKKQIGLIFLFIGIAIVFNPTQKFLFQRETWHLIDYLIAGIIALSIIYDWFSNILQSRNSSSIMNDKTLIKKRIAKEVLFFFASLCLVGLIWVFLLLRNSYYDYKEKKLKEHIAFLTDQLDSLPVDKIKAIYVGLSNNFVVNYKADNNQYIILKNEVEEFLKDNPTAKRLQNNPTGYFYCKTSNLGYFDPAKYGAVEIFRPAKRYLYQGQKIPLEVIKEAARQSNLDVNTYLQKTDMKPIYDDSDSTMVFDFVDLETFRTFLKSKEYRDKFYSQFQTSKTAQDYKYDLGSQDSFESNVESGLNHDKSIEGMRKKIKEEMISNDESIRETGVSIWDSEKIKWFLLNTALIILIFLYPIRFCFLLIGWAIKAVK